MYIAINLIAFVINAIGNSALPVVTKIACKIKPNYLFYAAADVSVVWSLTGFVVISITVLACASPTYHSGE